MMPMKADMHTKTTNERSKNLLKTNKENIREKSPNIKGELKVKETIEPNVKSKNKIKTSSFPTKDKQKVRSKNTREKNDFYESPDYLIGKLLERGVMINKLVMECCCGRGALSTPLINAGYSVVSSDLIDRGFGLKQNFLTYNKKFSGDILSNPPFKHSQSIIEHGMDLIDEGNQIIMLLPITFLEGKRRVTFFEKYPPKYIYVSSSRINCAKQGKFYLISENSKMCLAFFFFQKGFDGEPTIRWFNK